MMFKSLVLLALGACAQNDRPGFVATPGCTPNELAGVFSWCYTLVNGETTTIVAFRNNGDDAVDILVGTNGTNAGNPAGWCGWGVSDNAGMVNSAVIVGTADQAFNTDPAMFDRVIGDVRAAPTPSAQQQGVASVIGALDDGNFGILFTRPRTVDGLAESRQLTGDTYMVAACGVTFGQQHDIEALFFQVNADTGALTAANPDNAASALGAMSAALIVTVGVVFSSLW